MVVYPFYRRRVCSVKCAPRAGPRGLSTASRPRSEEHTSELQSQSKLVCRLLLEKKKNQQLTSADMPDALTVTELLARYEEQGYLMSSGIDPWRKLRCAACRTEIFDEASHGDRMA